MTSSETPSPAELAVKDQSRHTIKDKIPLCHNLWTFSKARSLATRSAAELAVKKEMTRAFLHNRLTSRHNLWSPLGVLTLHPAELRHQTATRNRRSSPKAMAPVFYRRLRLHPSAPGQPRHRPASTLCNARYHVRRTSETSTRYRPRLDNTTGRRIPFTSRLSACPRQLARGRIRTFCNLARHT